jgi:hypothetical protein
LSRTGTRTQLNGRLTLAARARRGVCGFGWSWLETILGGGRRPFSVSISSTPLSMFRELNAKLNCGLLARAPDGDAEPTPGFASAAALVAPRERVLAVPRRGFGPC